MVSGDIIYFQQEWLIRLQNFSPNDIWVAKNRGPKDSRPGKWTKLLHYPFYKLGLVDYRTVLPNEVCIEMDFIKWHNQKFWGKRIVDVLQEKDIPYVLCHSGGKGLHFHLFFNANGIEQLTGLRQIREQLYNYILNCADVPRSKRGARKPFDITSVSFNDRGQGHLIREIGGKKRQRKRPIESIPKDNSIITGDIEYPERLSVWDVSTEILKTLKLKNLEGLGNCQNCTIKIPSVCKTVFGTPSEEGPIWLGCNICKYK